MLLAASFFAGLGNAPFHPVDFTILNKRVSQQRVGHAFSVHGLSGNLGWALAPLFMAGITTATGSASGLLGRSLCAAVVLAIMVFNRDALDDRAESPVRAKPATAAMAAPQEHPMAFMKAAIGVAVLFLLLLEHLRAQRHPELASPALQSMYGLPLSVTALIVTGYMLCGAAGMVVGGFLVGRVQRLEKVISICMLGSGLLLFVVGTGWLPGMAAVVVASVAGLGTGLAGPRATC
jgi:MFS family permease